MVYSDVSKYLALYDGKDVSGHWRWRILVPFLARIIPDFSPKFFSPERIFSNFWVAKFKFGIVNLFFLSGVGIVLFYYLVGFGFSMWGSLVGVFLFYTARPVIQYCGLPMADSAAYFFTLLCFLALQRKSVFFLFVSFILGTLVKEAVFLSFPALLALEGDKRFKLKSALLMVAVFMAYFLVRFYIWPDYEENKFNLPLILSFKYHIQSLSRFNYLMDLISSFSGVWILAGIGFFLSSTPKLLKRWSWLILLMLVIAGSVGRIIFLAFPVVIPLAVGGLEYTYDYFFKVKDVR